MLKITGENENLNDDGLCLSFPDHCKRFGWAPMKTILEEQLG